MTNPTKSQDDLIAFVTDPATIKKAVEHSMEKRRQVMYPTKAEEMRDAITDIITETLDFYYGKEIKHRVWRPHGIAVNKLMSLFTSALEAQDVESRLQKAIGLSGNEFAMGYDDSGCFWRFYAGNRGAGSMMGNPDFYSESPEVGEALAEYIAYATNELQSHPTQKEKL